MATYAFAVQIYCDFSGYSDIAIGSARLMGVSLPENFRSPYLSLSIREFWRRWHITLSTWLRDYLYIPLGGSRKGEVRTYLNLMITMLLGGLWHGAGWTWIVWGGIQGFVMSARAAVAPLGGGAGIGFRTSRSVGGYLPHSVSFLDFLPFPIPRGRFDCHRADCLVGAGRILRRAGADRCIDAPSPRGEGAPYARCGCVRRDRRPGALRWVVYAALLVFVVTFAGARNPEFIYFQF